MKKLAEAQRVHLRNIKSKFGKNRSRTQLIGYLINKLDIDSSLMRYRNSI